MIVASHTQRVTRCGHQSPALRKQNTYHHHCRPSVYSCLYSTHVLASVGAIFRLHQEATCATPLAFQPHPRRPLTRSPFQTATSTNAAPLPLITRRLSLITAPF